MFAPVQICSNWVPLLHIKYIDLWWWYRYAVKLNTLEADSDSGLSPARLFSSNMMKPRCRLSEKIAVNLYQIKLINLFPEHNSLKLCSVTATSSGLSICFLKYPRIVMLLCFLCSSVKCLGHLKVFTMWSKLHSSPTHSRLTKLQLHTAIKEHAI